MMQFHTLLNYCVKQVGSGKQVSLKQIGAGAINQNYCLRVDSERYLVKQFTGNRWLPVNRGDMFLLQQELARKSIAATPLHLSDNQKIFIEQWIEHEPMDASEMQDDEVFDCLAHGLMTIHQQTLFDDENAKHTLDLVKQWRSYLKYFPDPEKKWRAKTNEYAQVWREYVQTYEADFVLCHNDLSLGHIARTQHDTRFLDWEYAGKGCRFFDLVACNLANQFSQAQADLLIRRYIELSDYHRGEVQQRVAIVQPMVIFTYQLWHKANEHQLAKREKPVK